jgi:hypothetical protein
LPGRYEVARHPAGWPLIEVRGPGQIGAEAGLAVAVLTIGPDEPPFRAVTSTGMMLALQLRDVHPVLSTVFTVKLRTWVDAVISDLLARFEQVTRAAVSRPRSDRDPAP